MDREDRWINRGPTARRARPPSGPSLRLEPKPLVGPSKPRASGRITVNDFERLLLERLAHLERLHHTVPAPPRLQW